VDLFERLDGDARSRLRPAPHPEWVAPMLAKLTDERFSDPDWLFERKLDGVRCLAFRHGDDVRLYSRSRQRMAVTYPEIAAVLAEEAPQDVVVDGEIVAFDGEQTSFSRLQQRLGITDPDKARRSPVAVHYIVFDVLHLDGQDTTALALRDRKALLRDLFTFADPLRYSDHREGDGEAFFAEACARGWEGIIAKRAASPYVTRRTSDWLKFKCSAAQEFVIGGFTEPSGSRQGFGALLVGYFDDDDFVYAGKVGTGFGAALLSDMRRLFDELETDASPFTRGTITERDAHWVPPEIVVEVGFSEWTNDGKLRHPRFLGIRRDKAARDVVRERPS
jgi:DNA ligase D-like protein (predicted ligase)